MTAQPASPALAKVSKGCLCSGCGACAAIAPDALSIEGDRAGFLRPVQTAPLTAEQERRVAEACPGLGLTQDPAGRTDHPLWGPYISVETCHAADPALRHRASSGGGLSAILVHLLDSGAVDRVLQVAADPDLPFANRIVLNATAEQVFDSAGSRYAPSAPLAGIGPLLDTDLRIAFVGKPCDVAALRALARSDPRIDQRFPYMLSFFCAGVPSLTGAREVLKRLGVAEASLASFRYRGDGWPGFATATTTAGETSRMSYADSWGGILARNLQFRCKICPDGTGGFADLVCADAWEADEQGYPLFEERDGVSLVMSRTDKGEALLRDAQASGHIAVSPFALETLVSIQPGQRDKRRLALSRIAALVVSGRPRPAFRGFHLLRNAGQAGILALGKNFLGTLKRIVTGRL
jgi:coenzyme F420 hydrogenase subunit beta